MSRLYIPRPDGVNLVLMCTNFHKALEKDAGVEITSYNEAFQELARLFDMMGPLFATMANDLRDQVKILDRLLKSAEGPNYATVQKMIEYELADPERRLESPLGKRKDQSGSRTVLHLNRTLDFLMQFLGKMCPVGDDEKMAGICSPVYKETLCKYHSWLLSKAAGIAIATLPTKIQLYEKMSKHDYRETTQAMPKLVASMKMIHAATDELFARDKLQKLPF